MMLDTDGDWDDEADLLNTSAITIVSFVPAKGMGWEGEVALLRSIMTSVIEFDRLHDAPFLFAISERLTLQRFPNGPLTVETSFADGRSEYNADGDFDDLLSDAATDTINRDI